MTASEPFAVPAPLPYRALADAVAGRPLPLALLDLDLLEANARALLGRAGTLPIRLGSKSIRCVEVMRRVQALSPRFQGLLCYSAREAAWLATIGFDDLLVAYPTVDPADVAAVAAPLAQGRRIVLMVDDAEQVAHLAAAAQALGIMLPLCIDLDMSMPLPGLHFGVRRSPIATPAAAVALAQCIARHRELKLVGLMGYEGQIAGLQDALPGQAVKNVMVRALKRRSIRQLTERRSAAVAALDDAGFVLEFVNGGGTGSLESTREDASVTEIAAGSGLYSPGLFDHFAAFRHQPALCFALQVVRRPLPDVVTCAGGGYIASGPIGVDRLPLPYLPAGGVLLMQEGAGEVQTPVKLPTGTVPPAIGDPLFFRHAKAGELAERFDRFLLLRRGAVVGEVPTYRGQGQNFF